MSRGNNYVRKLRFTIFKSESFKLGKFTGHKCDPDSAKSRCCSLS